MGRRADIKPLPSLEELQRLLSYDETTGIRWRNLRGTSNGPNIQNSRIRKDNKSGIKGVHWDAHHKAWRAVITANKTSVRLGRFKRLEDAEAAVLAARMKLHGDFARAA